MTGLEITSVSRTLFVSVLACLLLVSVFTSPVAADSHGDWETEGGIICGNTDAATDTQVVFSYIIGIFMILGFVFGLIMFAAEKFEDSVMGEKYEILGGIEGKSAMRKAVLLPILVYFFDFISEPIFGIDISCIVPSL